MLIDKQVLSFWQLTCILTWIFLCTYVVRFFTASRSRPAIASANHCAVDSEAGEGLSAHERLRWYLERNSHNSSFNTDEFQYVKSLLEEAEREEKSKAGIAAPADDVLSTSSHAGTSARPKLPHSPKTPSPLRKTFDPYEDVAPTYEIPSSPPSIRSIKSEQSQIHETPVIVKNQRALGRKTHKSTSASVTTIVKQPLSLELSSPTKSFMDKLTASENSQIDSVLGENEFEVGKIVNVRGRGLHKQWLVRWKGYSARHDTWEPAENLGNAWDLIKAFERTQRQDHSTKKSSAVLKVQP